MGADPARVGPPSSHVLETEIDGSISLYDPAGEQVMVLNQTASDIWLLADGEHTVDEIVDLLAHAYSVSPSAIRQDVTRTITELIEFGFLPSDGLA